MQQVITDIVRQEFIRCVPSSLVEDVSCFTFYDNHPQDSRHIDIVVCTKKGELKEYFRRDIVSSLNLQSNSSPTEVSIIRNSNGALFYLVSAGSELFVVSTKCNLSIHEKIINVDRFVLDDTNCDGEIYLKVYKSDDAVPIVYDENFKCGEDIIPSEKSADQQPLATELKRKLIEAKYSVQNYEQIMHGYVDMRHKAALEIYDNLRPNHADSVCRSGIYGALKVKTQKPWVKVCNKRLVIAITVMNEYREILEDLNILLNSANRQSLSYTTKQFETHPILREKQSQQLLPNQEATIMAVLSLEDLNMTSIIVLNIALSYKLKKVFLLPFEDILISSLDILGDDFDVLSSSNCDINTMMAIQSTTVKTELCIRDIKHGTSDLLQKLQNLFIKYLHMDKIGNDMVVYKKSPYHALNGTLLHFVSSNDRTAEVIVYSRSESQVLALVHSIMNAVRAQLVITTSNYRLSANIPELSLNETKPPITEHDYSEYAKTILNRTALIIEYLDWCMVKMSESKNPEIVRQIGFQIDLYACGNTGYKEFRDKMKIEAEKGVVCLLNAAEANVAEPMLIG